MSTSARVAANQTNAQSTGPTSEAGKAKSSQNHHIHGFTGVFCLIKDENPEEFQELLAALIQEHHPTTATECMLIEKMGQHFWTGQRAMRFQAELLIEEDSPERDKKLSLYLRYQTTHDRPFHKCLSDLLKLRAERRKALREEEKRRLDEAALCQRAEDSKKSV